MAVSYFSVTTQSAITGVRPDIATDLARDVAHRTVQETVTAADVTTAAAAGIVASAQIVKTNEFDRVIVNATSGNYTLTFGAQTTASILFNATAAQVEAALVALSTIAAGEVVVTGGPGDSGGTTPYYVQFIGPQAGTNVGALTGTTVDLAGGGAAVTVATLQAGGVSPQ